MCSDIIFCRNGGKCQVDRRREVETKLRNKKKKKQRNRQLIKLTLWSLSGGRTIVLSMVFSTIFQSSLRTRFRTVFSQILANNIKLGSSKEGHLSGQQLNHMFQNWANMAESSDRWCLQIIILRKKPPVIYGVCAPALILHYCAGRVSETGRRIWHFHIIKRIPCNTPLASMLLWQMVESGSHSSAEPYQFLQKCCLKIPLK